LEDRPVNFLAISESGHVFAGTGDVYRSTDNGNNWKKINNGLPDDTGVGPLAINDSGHIFAGTYLASSVLLTMGITG